MTDSISIEPFAALPDSVAQRKQQYLSAFVTEAEQWYTNEGDWRLDIRPPLPHERMLVAVALFSQARNARAAAILRKAKTNVPGDFAYDIFDTNLAPWIIKEYGHVLPSDLRDHLMALVRNGNGTVGQGNLRPALRAMGINDNMPIAAAYGLIVGGEMTGQDEAVEHGIWILRDYCRLLQNGWINAEYNSPTYTPIVLMHLANLIEQASNPEAVTLARHIESRLWLDLASRFHPDLAQLVGPFSRAYTNGMVGHFTILSSVLWMLLGDRIAFPPLDLLKPTPAVIHLLGDVPFNLSLYVWFFVPDYHIPVSAWERLQSKPYPQSHTATCNHAFLGEDHPARQETIETYLEPDFGFGVSTSGFATGASSTPYHLTYRVCDEDSPRRSAVAYTKVLINDDQPGRIGSYEAVHHASHSGSKSIIFLDDDAHDQVKTFSNSGEHYSLVDHGRSSGYRVGRGAVVLTQPSLSLGGAGFDTGMNPQEPTPIKRLGQWLIFPSHFSECDEIAVGSQRRPDWSGTVAPCEWIVMRRGQTFIAVLPLAWSRDGGPADVSLCRSGKYECINAKWHEDESRTFTRSELAGLFGGWVVEHASSKEYETLEAFAQQLQSASVTDAYYSSRWVTYSRTPNAPSFEACISPGASQAQNVTVIEPDQPMDITDQSYRRRPVIPDIFRSGRSNLVPRLMISQTPNALKP